MDLSACLCAYTHKKATPLKNILTDNDTSVLKMGNYFYASLSIINDDSEVFTLESLQASIDFIL